MGYVHRKPLLFRVTQSRLLFCLNLFSLYLVCPIHFGSHNISPKQSPKKNKPYWMTGLYPGSIRINRSFATYSLALTVMSTYGGNAVEQNITLPFCHFCL